MPFLWVTGDDFEDREEWGAALGRAGIEDWFWVCGLGAITDSNPAIGSDEHIPVLHSKSEYSIRIFGSVMLLEQTVKGVAINKFIQWWEFKRVNSGCFCKSFNNDFRR